MIKLKHLLENFANDFRVTKNSEFRDYIKRVEGKRLDAYDLGDGMITIGYGHSEPTSKSAYKVGDEITDSEAEQLLTQDIQAAETKVNSYIQSNFPDLTELSLLQKQMLTDFAYNPGLSKFPKFVSAVITKDWDTVKQEYKRYFNGKELGRNKIFHDVFLSKIDDIASKPKPKLTRADVNISPNPVAATEQITITIPSEFLPYQTIKLAVANSVGSIIDTHAWNDVMRGILKFNAPTTPGRYYISIITDTDKVATQLIVN